MPWMKNITSLTIFISVILLVESLWQYNSITNSCKKLQKHSKLYDLDNIHQCVASHDIDLFKCALEGAVAGGSRALSKGLTYPFDTIKTLLQANDNITTKKKSLTINEYFRGVTPTVLSAIPANALFFVVYFPLENYVISNCNDITLDSSQLFLIRLIISTIATLPQNLIKIPAELIKQRAQTQPNMNYKELLSQAMKDEGLFGLYCGWESQLLREIPYNAFQMTSYSYLSDIIQNNNIFHYLQVHTITSSAILGLLAAFIAALLTQPADLIKTKVMTQTNKTNDNSIITVTRRILEKEGISGFFVGLQARLSIVSIGGMIYFWSSNIVETLLK